MITLALFAGFFCWVIALVILGAGIEDSSGIHVLPMALFIALGFLSFGIAGTAYDKQKTTCKTIEIDGTSYIQKEGCK